MDGGGAARLQLRGQRGAAAFEIVDAAFTDADEQQPLRGAAVYRRGFGDRARRPVEPRLCRRRAEQRVEGPGTALADRKGDDVGRRIDLRDKLNVHLLTFLCGD